jgi:hypothetical protein
MLQVVGWFSLVFVETSITPSSSLGICIGIYDSVLLFGLIWIDSFPSLQDRIYQTYSI